MHIECDVYLCCLLGYCLIMCYVVCLKGKIVECVNCGCRGCSGWWCIRWFLLCHCRDHQWHLMSSILSCDVKYCAASLFCDIVTDLVDDFVSYHCSNHWNFWHFMHYASLSVYIAHFLLFLQKNTKVLFFRSTLLSWPNKVGLNSQMSVCTYVRPSTKRSFDFNEIWHVGRGRWVKHDIMQYDPIQGQGHEPFRVGNTSIFYSCLLYHLQWELSPLILKLGHNI